MNLAQTTALILADIRERKPRVHCITNDAAQAFTADTLLALGAEPSLSLAKSEIPDFVGSSDALLINLGTLDEKVQNLTEYDVFEAIGEKLPVGRRVRRGVDDGDPSPR